nr:hypothetical protein [Tanacetum cinerariifolium]
MTMVIKEEFEQLGLLKIDDDLFTYDTQLRMIFNEFNRLSGIINDLVSYEIKVSKPTLCDEQRTCNPTYNDLKEYEWKMSYEECEKIYAEAVISINKILVRLIDVTMEQWLELKYGNHKTMDKNVKKGVTGTWLIRSYKLQFKEYLEIKKKRDTYAREVDMEYDPSNLVFVEWLALKFYNHLDMDWYTKNALWVYWMRDTMSCEPFRFKNEKAKWPTCSSNDDGFCNRGELPGMVWVGYMTYFQDYEWNGKASNNSDVHEKEEEHKERCNLFDNIAHDAPVCKIRRFEMIEYSFGQDEEYVAIKEC